VFTDILHLLMNNVFLIFCRFWVLQYLLINLISGYCKTVGSTKYASYTSVPIIKIGISTSTPPKTKQHSLHALI